MSQPWSFIVNCCRCISPIKCDFGLSLMFRPTAEVGKNVGRSPPIQTHLLTTWSRGMVFTPSQEITQVYGTRGFIAAFTSARHLSLSWATSIQSKPPLRTSWRYIVNYPPIYAWVFEVPPKPCTQISSSSYVLHAPPISSFLIWSPEKYCVRSTDYLAPQLVVFSTPLLSRLFEHPFLKHTQPTVLPQCERPSFTPI